jgi:hypothetical protein
MHQTETKNQAEIVEDGVRSGRSLYYRAFEKAGRRTQLKDTRDQLKETEDVLDSRE